MWRQWKSWRKMGDCRGDVKGFHQLHALSLQGSLDEVVLVETEVVRQRQASFAPCRLSSLLDEGGEMPFEGDLPSRG